MPEIFSFGITLCQMLSGDALFRLFPTTSVSRRSHRVSCVHYSNLAGLLSYMMKCLPHEHPEESRSEGDGYSADTAFGAPGASTTRCLPPCCCCWWSGGRAIAADKLFRKHISISNSCMHSATWNSINDAPRNYEVRLTSKLTGTQTRQVRLSRWGGRNTATT